MMLDMNDGSAEAIISSFKYHIMNAKNNGVTAEEMAEVITHAAVYNTLLTMSKAAAVSALPS